MSNDSDDEFAEHLFGEMGRIAHALVDDVPGITRSDCDRVGQGQIVLALEAGGVHILSERDSHFSPIGLVALRTGRVYSVRRGFGRTTTRDFDVRRISSVEYKPGWKSDELRIALGADVFTYYFVKPRGGGAAFQLYVSKLQAQGEPEMHSERPVQGQVADGSPAFCAACGSRLRAAARFCPTCGRAVS